MELSTTLLDSYREKNIKDICPCGYHASSLNHCAHFVSHVLNLQFGQTCGPLAHRKEKGVNVRVQEVFAESEEAEQLNACDLKLPPGLMIVSDAKHFISTRGSHAIRNVPAKHIGIYLEGRIWHYSNSKHKVTQEYFIDFIRHYPKTAHTNALWWASLPAQADARAWVAIK